jgi:hypothetical protein
MRLASPHYLTTTLPLSEASLDCISLVPRPLPLKNGRGEGLGTLAKSLGFADVAFLIPGMSQVALGHTALASLPTFNAVGLLLHQLQKTSLAFHPEPIVSS